MPSVPEIPSTRYEKHSRALLAGRVLDSILQFANSIQFSLNRLPFN